MYAANLCGVSGRTTLLRIIDPQCASITWGASALHHFLIAGIRPDSTPNPSAARFHCTNALQGNFPGGIRIDARIGPSGWGDWGPLSRIASLSVASSQRAAPHSVKRSVAPVRAPVRCLRPTSLRVSAGETCASSIYRGGVLNAQMARRWRTLGEFIGRFSRRPRAMLVIQSTHFCERDPHSKRVVAVSAIRRETDDRVAYFRVVGLG
jgi:hypothetical protein